MNITNDREVMIFRNEENGKVKYSTSISKKAEDGSYENAPFQIQFNKSVELEDRTKIKIKSAWLSFYKWEYQGKKGTTYFVKCNDFDLVGQAVTPNEFEDLHTRTESNMSDDVFSDFGNQVELDESDVNFDIAF
jgi:hypothetical protein